VNDGFVDCKYMHAGTCLEACVTVAMKTLKLNYKYYVPFHLIPLIISKKLFKFKEKLFYNL